MAKSEIRIDEILSGEYGDFLEYCTMADKQYTSELTSADYIAYRTQFGVSRELAKKIQSIVECYNEDTVKSTDVKCSKEKNDSEIKSSESTDTREKNINCDAPKTDSELWSSVEKQPTISLYKIWNTKNPYIYQDVKLQNMKFSVRAKNAFEMAGLTTLGELLLYSLHELESLPHIGKTTIENILSTIDSFIKRREDSTFENDPKSVFSEEFFEQIHNLLLGESYSLECLNEGETVYFLKCKEAKDLLGEKLCILALEQDSYIIKLRSFLDDLNGISYLYKIRASLSTLPEETLNQPICYYWKAYYESICMGYLKVPRKTWELDIEILDYFNDGTSLIKTLPDFFLRREYSHETMKICLDFVEWFCTDLVKRIHETIENCIEQEDNRRSEVLVLRANGKTLNEIGSELNVSRERVRQMETKAIQKFRQRYKKEKCDVILALCAVRGGDGFIREEEMKNSLGEEDTRLILYLLDRGGLDSTEYCYDKANKIVIIGDHENIDVVEIVKGFPEEILNTELDEIISKASGNDSYTKERILFEFNQEYKIYGKYYHRGRITTVKICDHILQHYFPNGYKIANADYEKQFRNIMHECYGDVKGLPTGHSIDSKMEEVGLLYDRGVYIHPSYISVKQEVIDSINKFIGDNTKEVLSYDEIFNSMSAELRGTQITNKYILHGVLNVYGCPYITRQSYVTKKESQNLLKEIDRYIKNNRKVHISALADEFSLSNTRLYQIIFRDPEIIGLDKCYYMHSSKLIIHKGDKDKFYKYIGSLCTTAPVSVHVLLNDFNMYFTDFVIENDIQSQWDLFGILQYLFKDEFRFSRPYICKKDAGGINKKSVLLSYLDKVDSIEIDDLNNLSESQGVNFASIPDMLTNLQPEYVRINETTIMRSDLVGLSEDVIYQILEIIQSDAEVYRYLPTNQITDFSWYPDINVEWTPFLIESIITGMIKDNITYVQIPLGKSALPSIIFLSEEFADDDYQSFILKILKEEHENIPFNSKEEILSWLQNKGLCYKKLPFFLVDDRYLYYDDNGVLMIKNE